SAGRDAVRQDGHRSAGNVTIAEHTGQQHRLPKARMQRRLAGAREADVVEVGGSAERVRESGLERIERRKRRIVAFAPARARATALAIATVEGAEPETR